VTGNFLKNKEVLQYFDYEVAGSLENAEYIDQNGLFVGNHQVDIKDKISDLHKLLR
jgi:CDP-6-deoxy-D-xylo-4-hexulose-3-dehydrase